MNFPAVPPRLLLAGGVLAVLLAVLLAGGLLYGHSRYNAGQADVQALWDADKAVATQALLAAASRADDIRRADAAISEQVQHDLQTRALAADARNADLIRRLRDYEKRACDRAVSYPTSPPAGTTPAGPESGGDSGIGAAVGDVTGACRHDADRLAGWQAWWRGVEANR